MFLRFIQGMVMNAYMRLLFIALSLVGTMQAIQIKIENRLIDNLNISYYTDEGFVPIAVPLGGSIAIASKFSNLWGPIKFTYNNKTYRLSHTTKGWNFHISDPQTKHLLPYNQPIPYMTLRDAEMVGFVLVPSPEGGARIYLNTDISEKNLRYIDEQIENLKYSLRELFPKIEPHAEGATLYTLAQSSQK